MTDRMKTVVWAGVPCLVRADMKLKVLGPQMRAADPFKCKGWFTNDATRDADRRRDCLTDAPIAYLPKSSRAAA